MEYILNLVINYANEKEVIEYAKALEKQTFSNRMILIIVINKKSEELKFDFEKQLEELKLSIKVYDAGENLGYLNGAFFGYKKFVQENNLDFNWVIISNTDLIFKDSNFMREFISFNYSEDTWCVGPSIYNKNNNTYDNPKYVNRIPLSKINKTLFIHSYSLLSLIYLSLAKLKAKISKNEKQKSQFCYAVQGCFFALKKDFIEKIKNKKFEGFLYSEENYIAELLNIFNKKCYYNSNVEIIHNEKQSTGLLNYKKRADYYFNSIKFIKNEFYLRNDEDVN